MSRKNNKVKCVFVIPKNGKPYRYMTRVIIQGTRFYLGCYKTEEEAFNTYKKFIKDMEKMNLGERV